uniref:Prepronociceptin n=1 Tax=Varanus komodoensis TaxID=61221 RepID=A0A8D2IK28_VARKO
MQSWQKAKRRPSAFPSASIRLGQTLPVNSSSCPLFLQICVMECEGRLPSSATWDLCSKMPNGSEWPLENGLLRQPEAEGDGGHGGRVPRRMSDFLSGPFSYGQLAEPGVQELQKRFGGFIGVRKSARKWHNQKRFSEFLKQYLGMAPRSVEYDDFPDDAKEQNEI